MRKFDSDIRLAREIVVMGFTVVIATLSAIAVVSVLILGRHAFFESGSTEEEDKR